MKENNVKITIASLFFLLCFIVILLVYFFQKPNNLKKEETPFKMNIVTEYASFFSVLNDINQYVKYNSLRDNIATYNVLNREYIEKNGINTSNVFDKLELYQDNVSLKIKEMYYEENESNFLYYVIGDIIAILYDETELVKKDVKFFVSVDYDNTAFSLYPVLSDIEEIPLANKWSSVILNSYNGIQASGIVTNNYICNLYFSDYVMKLSTNIHESYELLEEYFKVHNYKNKEDYISYINNNLEKISLEINTCNMKTRDGQRIYTITDKNNNTFNFVEESIMNYKVNFKMD